MKFLLHIIAFIGLTSALELPEAAEKSLEKKRSSSNRLFKQQMFELQLELAAKNKSTSHATAAVATSHEALQQLISVLEEDNARLRDAGGDDEHFPDEVEEDEGARVIMCDCGIDLLAQMQQNRALQNELKTERLQFQVIQGQLENLRKQVSEREEKINNVTAQIVIAIRKEQTKRSIKIP